jgi:hypothetical protein
MSLISLPHVFKPKSSRQPHASLQHFIIRQAAPFAATQPEMLFVGISIVKLPAAVATNENTKWG